jgi:hypothetical protein
VITERCLLCDQEFVTCKPAVRICTRCEREQGAIYAVPVVFSDPWRFSRPVMQERLSVSGREDS